MAAVWFGSLHRSHQNRIRSTENSSIEY